MKKIAQILAWYSFTFAFSIHTLAAQNATVASNGVQVFTSSHHAITPPLRSLAVSHVLYAGAHSNREILQHKPPFSNVARSSLAPTFESALSPPALVAPLSSNVNFGQNFDGMSVNADVALLGVGIVPPDTNGAVGATQYVQTVNTALAVYDKASGNLLFGPIASSQIFSSLPSSSACRADGQGDPVILYDKLTNVWLFSIGGFQSSTLSQCIAVSTSSDATSTWNVWDFQTGSNLYDYGKLGVWPDGYYYSADVFDQNSNYVGAIACSFDRAKMIPPSVSNTLTEVCFTNPSLFALTPADLDGVTPPPAGEPNFFLGLGSSQSVAGADNTNLVLYKFHVDFATPATSSFTGPVFVAVPSYSQLCLNTCFGVPQYQTTEPLDPLSFPLMFRLAYRNIGGTEYLAANHAIDTTSFTGTANGGVRWYQIANPAAATPTLAQWGTYTGPSSSPDTNWRWMGSIAMDKHGDIGLGYSESNTDIFPSIAVTGQAFGDPTGTMEDETVAFSGTGSQQSGLNRWGDYSDMTVDPVDDCTFWYTTEYLPNNAIYNWNTRIASFRFTGCPTSTPDFDVSTTPLSSPLTPGGSPGSSTVTVSALNGFAGTVNLDAQAIGTSAGLSVTMGPTSISSFPGSSMLTINTGGATPGGNYPVLITATSGSGPSTIHHSGYVNMAVNGYTLNSAVSPSPNGNLYVNQRGSATGNISLNNFYGFSGPVTLSVNNLPTGVTTSLNPNSISGTATAVMTVNATANATPQLLSPLSVTGTSGSLTQSVNALLAISAALGTGGAGTPLDLSRYFNVDAIYQDGASIPTVGGIDGGGNGVSAQLLTPSRILSGTQFNFGPPNTGGGLVNDAVLGTGASISVPPSQQAPYSGLQMIATVGGNRNGLQGQTITVTYTDGSSDQFLQNFSDWGSLRGTQPPTAVGEVPAVAMPYRDVDDGSQQFGPTYVFGYSFALNTAKSISSITLPNDAGPGGRLVVLAMTFNGIPEYTITGTVLSPATISHGASSRSSISITPLGGYTGIIKLSCSVAPSTGTCSFSPSNQVNITGATPVSSTLIFTAPASGSLVSASDSGGASRGLPGAYLVLCFAGLTLLWTARNPRMRRAYSASLTLACVLGALAVLPSCGGNSGGGSGGGSQPTTYTVMVNAKDASGATQANTAVTLTVTVQ